MWNLHFFFNLVLLIQNTASEKSLIDYNCFPKIIDCQRNDLSYICLYFEHNLFFSDFLLALYFLFAVLLFHRIFFFFYFVFSYLSIIFHSSNHWFNWLIRLLCTSIISTADRLLWSVTGEVEDGKVQLKLTIPIFFKNMWVSQKY